MGQHDCVPGQEVHRNETCLKIVPTYRIVGGPTRRELLDALEYGAGAPGDSMLVVDQPLKAIFVVSLPFVDGKSTNPDAENRFSFVVIIDGANRKKPGSDFWKITGEIRSQYRPEWNEKRCEIIDYNPIERAGKIRIFI